MTNRNIQLDFIRCVALFLIILCHTHIGLDNVSPYIAKIKWFVGKCGVPLFLIISGYLNLPMKYKDKEYLKIRFKRVGIPFLFWCIIYRILSIIFNNDGKMPYLSEDIFLISSSAHLWYIYAILALYLITPIISDYFQKCSQGIFQFYLLIWLISGLFTYYYHWTGHSFFDHNVTYITYYLGGYVGYYLLGYYMKRFSPTWIFERINIKRGLILGGIFLLVLNFIYIGYYLLDMTTVEISKYTTIVPILFSLFMFSFLWKIKITKNYISKSIVSLSKYSFGIYLVHEIIIIYLFPVFVGQQDWSGINDITLLFINVLFVLLNIVISYIIVRVLSFLPKSKYILG